MNKAPIQANNSVIVFDLDDTLYSEFDYKISGIHAVCQRIAQLYPQYNAQLLFEHINPKHSNWLDDLCQYCQFNHHEKTSLLWHYRLHQPNIKLNIAKQSLVALIDRFVASAILSDGRSMTQRLKLNALGLEYCFDHILISEAYSSEKPQPERFNFICQHYPNQQWLYIGDNIKKDFITPNQQGWITVGLTPKQHHIHQYPINDFPKEYQPHYWIEQLEDIENLLC